MTKRTLLLFVTALTAVCAAAQVTLDGCKRMARDNYPAVRQYRLIEQSRDYTVANAAKGYLPQVSVTAGASMFTDLIDGKAGMGLNIGNELYSAGIQISQTIYDGGAIAAGKRTARAQAEVSRGQLDVTMYEINSRVEQLYFGILTLDERLKHNRLLQNDLEISGRTVTEMMAGGIANRSDLDAVSVERMKALQAESGLKASRRAYVRMLSALTGTPIHDSTALETPPLPEEQPADAAANRRPELDYYNARGRLLDERRRSLDAALMPRLGAFGTGMYHNKVMSRMSNSLFAAGVSLSWNIGALYTRQNDIRKIDTERRRTESERETFLFNSRLQSENANGLIDNLRQQIALDDSIIALREAIRDKAETKVKNGTETVNEMLRDINAVSEARQAKAIHEIELVKEIYNLKNINNNRHEDNTTDNAPRSRRNHSLRRRRQGV